MRVRQRCDRSVLCRLRQRVAFRQIDFFPRIFDLVSGRGIDLRQVLYLRFPSVFFLQFNYRSVRQLHFQYRRADTVTVIIIVPDLLDRRFRLDLLIDNHSVVSDFFLIRFISRISDRFLYRILDLACRTFLVLRKMYEACDPFCAFVCPGDCRFRSYASRQFDFMNRFTSVCVQRERDCRTCRRCCRSIRVQPFFPCADLRLDLLIGDRSAIFDFNIVIRLHLISRIVFLLIYIVRDFVLIVFDLAGELVEFTDIRVFRKVHKACDPCIALISAAHCRCIRFRRSVQHYFVFVCNSCKVVVSSICDKRNRCAFRCYPCTIRIVPGLDCLDSGRFLNVLDRSVRFRGIILRNVSREVLSFLHGILDLVRCSLPVLGQILERSDPCFVFYSAREQDIKGFCFSVKNNYICCFYSVRKCCEFHFRSNRRRIRSVRVQPFLIHTELRCDLYVRDRSAVSDRFLIFQLISRIHDGLFYRIIYLLAGLIIHFGKSDKLRNPRFTLVSACAFRCLSSCSCQFDVVFRLFSVRHQGECHDCAFRRG